jgi:hypothetical protein
MIEFEGTQYIQYNNQRWQEKNKTFCVEKFQQEVPVLKVAEG